MGGRFCRTSQKSSCLFLPSHIKFSKQPSFSNPIKYNEFIKRIRFEPETAIPEYYEDWDQSASTLWINLPLKPQIQYKLWIDEELQDIFGNRLGEEVPLEFSTASYPPSLSMHTSHRILEADSDLKYPLYVINTPEILVEAALLEKKDKGLTPIQKVFFYMPLQHAESRKVQAKSVELFNRLAESVSPTYQETFLTVAQFAELHKDIIDQFGRFPHRNRLLGRDNTPEEEEYLADAPDFGQG